MNKKFKHTGFSDLFNTSVLIALAFCLKLQVTIGETKINSGGFSYSLHNTKKIWDDANVYCRKFVNGTLATITNKKTAEDIVKMFSIPSTPAWVGATNMASGHFEWVQDSRLVDGALWAPGEPNLGDPNSCVCLAQLALLQDEMCTSQRPFICQKIGEDPTTTIDTVTKTHNSSLKTYADTSPVLIPTNTVKCIKEQHECLYRNMLQQAATVFPPFLRETENIACSKLDFMSISFEKNVHFTSIQIAFQREDKNIKASLLFLLSNNTIIPCLYNVQYWTSASILEVECEFKSFITQVNVSLISDEAVCNVKIKGGRNVLPEGKFGLKLNGITMPNIETDHAKAMDDDIGSCFVMRKTEKEITWVTTFDYLRTIYEILIYTSSNPNASMSEFIMTLQGFESDILFSYNTTEILQVHEIDVFVPDVYKIMLKTVGLLAVCEFRVFGDCPKRKYGRNCEMVCTMTCRDQECQSTGVCKKCVPNRYGDYCMDYIKTPTYDFGHNGTTFTPIIHLYRASHFTFSPNMLKLAPAIIVLFCVLYMTITKRKKKTVVVRDNLARVQDSQVFE